MGAINLLVDATSDSPLLPMRSLVAICGGGDIQRNQHMEALYDYDATVPAMRRIVEALFHDPSYPADEDYVQRRYESSIAPGAWEALAAARFRRPGAAPPPTPSSKRAYERVSVPTLVVEGGCDKLLPPGWAKEIADQIPGGGQPWSRRPVIARRSSNRRSSTSCCWNSYSCGTRRLPPATAGYSDSECRWANQVISRPTMISSSKNTSSNKAAS